MCGLVGIISKRKSGFDYREKEAFKTALYVDALRGQDSTGLFSVDTDGNVSWAKESTTAQIFLDTQDVTKLLQDFIFDFRAVVGHNRKATKGAISDENAHPFVENNIILVHNGTLTNHESLTDKEVVVDSHAITHLMAELGVKEALSKLQGAFAIICYDINEKKLYALRNHQRPLFEVEFENSIMLVSEPWMAIGSMMREVTGAKPTVREIKAMSMRIYDMSEKELVVTTEDFVPAVHQSTAVVHRFPMTATEESTNVYSKHPMEGKIVVFSADDIVDRNNYWEITGKQDNYILRGHLSLYSHGKERVDSVLAAKSICGIVSSVYKGSRDKETLFLTNLSVSESIITRNGTVLNEADTLNDNLVCYSCNTFVETEEDLRASYVKVGRHGKFKCVCPDCVVAMLEKNPNWGGIKHYEKSIARSAQQIQ